MEKCQYDELRNQQQVHWWFTGKKTIIEDIFDSYCSNAEHNTILDIGCGMGIMLESLGKRGEVFGIEYDGEAVEYCKSFFCSSYAESHIFQGALPDDIPIRRKFDSIIVLDVLEHIEDDIKALDVIYDMLKIGGVLILTVPALMSMWSYNDELNHHYRRYEYNELNDKIKNAGFRIKKLSFYNSYLYPVAYLVRKIKNTFKIKTSDVRINNHESLVNRVLRKIFSSESKALKKKDFKRGVSLIVVAERKE